MHYKLNITQLDKPIAKGNEGYNSELRHCQLYKFGIYRIYRMTMMINHHRQISGIESTHQFPSLAFKNVSNFF